MRVSYKIIIIASLFLLFSPVPRTALAQEATPTPSSPLSEALITILSAMAQATPVATPSADGPIFATPTPTATPDAATDGDAAPTTRPTRTPIIIPTATPTPDAPPLVAPTVTEPAAPPTQAPAPTATPTVILGASASTATATSPGAAPAAPLPQNYQFRVIEPLDDVLQGRRTFAWETDIELGPNQMFELVFWPEGGDPMIDGFSPVGARPTTEVGVTLDQAADLLPNLLISSRNYRWGVLLVAFDPEYRRLQHLGGDHLFRFEASVDEDPAEICVGPGCEK